MFVGFDVGSYQKKQFSLEEFCLLVKQFFNVIDFIREDGFQITGLDDFNWDFGNGLGILSYKYMVTFFIKIYLYLRVIDQIIFSFFF